MDVEVSALSSTALEVRGCVNIQGNLTFNVANVSDGLTLPVPHQPMYIV